MGEAEDAASEDVELLLTKDLFASDECEPAPNYEIDLLGKSEEAIKLFIKATQSYQRAKENGQVPGAK